MIYSEQILQSTLESLSRRELEQLIKTLEAKTPIDDYAEFGIKKTIHVAEEVLIELNNDLDDAHRE